MKSPLHALSSTSMKGKSNQSLHIVSLLLEDYNYLHAGNFACFFVVQRFFLKLTLSKKLAGVLYQSVNQFGSRSDLMFCLA